MAVLTDAEAQYLAGQRLGRLATASAEGQPHVVPVGFRVDPAQGDVGGLDLTSSRKWRDLTVNPKVAFVVDDLASVDPWRPRGIEIRGRAELHASGGDRLGGGFGGAWLRIHPERIAAWGLDTDPHGAASSCGVGRGGAA